MGGGVLKTNKYFLFFSAAALKMPFAAMKGVGKKKGESWRRKRTPSQFKSDVKFSVPQKRIELMGALVRQALG